jgi:tetratricopeptide (TPR) repeat protein
MMAASLNALAYAEMLLGRVAAGEARMREALALYRELGNKALAADCLTAIAAAKIWQGQSQEGVKTAQAAEAICAEVANPWGHIYSRVWLATGLVDTGDYEAALATARAGHDQAKVHQLPAMSLFIKLVLGKVYQALGQPDAAYQVHSEALALNEQIKSEFHQAWIMAELCADCGLMKQWAEAATYARKAITHRNYTTVPLVIPAFWPETAALLRAGEPLLAQAELERWGEGLSHIPRFRPGYLHALALLAEAEGKLEQALDQLKEAYRLAEKIGLPEERRELLVALGRLYRASGEEEKAQQAFKEAQEIIQALAAEIEAEALRTGFWAAKGM